MLALTVRTAHHILSAGALLVAPDERWYHTGPLSSGVIVLIDLVTDRLPACCSLFCPTAFLAWCNWQKVYWSGNYCNTWDGLGLGGGRGSDLETHLRMPCRGNMKMILYWQGTALLFTRKLNHAAIHTHPPRDTPGTSDKLQSSLGTWVNWSLFLFTLTTCSLVWAAIYWFISVLI